MPAATILRGHNVRTRKLNPRANLPIIREDDLDGLDDDPQRNVPALETGIEKHEETVSVLSMVARLCVSLRFDVPGRAAFGGRTGGINLENLAQKNPVERKKHAT